MGQYRFVIPKSERIAAESLVAAHVVGLEGIPWPCKALLQDDTLVIARNQELSGRLLAPFRSTKYGELALTTGTLPETESAYFLELELARGSLCRLRNQVSIWQEGGLTISDDFLDRLDQVTVQFSKAVFCQEDAQRRVAICESVIESAVDLMFEITDEFSHQIALIHDAQPQNVPIIAGSVFETQECQPQNVDELTDFSVQRMTHPTSLQNAEDAIGTYDFSQTDGVIDWLNEPTIHSARIVGPLMQFDNIQLPGWLPEDATFETRMDTIKRMCRRFGAEYQKRIKILHVSSGLNGVGHQHFNYPQQLQVTLEMLESLDQVMPNTSMMVSFDQPWGERLSMATGGVQSMEIADQLLRYGARISAFGLEFNMDYWPQGTLMRDPLQWVDLIDRWSQFGLPLAIYLTVPTGDAESVGTSRFAQTIRNSTDASGYRRYLTTVFNLLVRRPAVNVVAWRRASDSDNQRFPLSGLIDVSGQPKGIFEWFERLVDNVIRSQRSIDDTHPS